MMPRPDPAKAVQVLLLLEFFDSGRRWIKGGISDPQGIAAFWARFIT